jgi:hypothetical protein
MVLRDQARAHLYQASAIALFLSSHTSSHAPIPTHANVSTIEIAKSQASSFKVDGFGADFTHAQPNRGGTVQHYVIYYLAVRGVWCGLHMNVTDTVPKTVALVPFP